MGVEFVVGSLPCSERFFSRYPGFPVSSKTNSTRNQVDEEPRSGCATSKSLFSYLFILLHLRLTYCGLLCRYCPKCKAHREATKQLSVWRLPEILIIHLKRFSFRNILFKDKITKLVEFPLRWVKFRFIFSSNHSPDTFSAILLPLHLASLSHRIHGMRPVGRKDRSIDLNMCICRNMTFV